MVSASSMACAAPVTMTVQTGAAWTVLALPTSVSMVKSGHAKVSAVAHRCVVAVSGDHAHSRPQKSAAMAVTMIATNNRMKAAKAVVMVPAEIA